MDSETPNNKRSILSEHIEQDESLQTETKRARPSLLNGFEAQSVTLAEVSSSEQAPILENFIRSLVQEVVKNQVNSYTQSILSINRQLSNKIGKECIGGLETWKLKLFFLNQTASNIFTNNEIEAENGKPLLVALCDTTNSNAIIKTGTLSSALVKLVVLDGEFGSDQRGEETCWSASDFNENIVSRRVGKRPLIVGNETMVYLKNGVGFIKGLRFSDNSSWTRSKKFRLGAKIDDKIGMFPRIGEAVSEPIRVMDHRGEMYKKHHPPSREDEIWRLEGIGKDGVYHSRLSSKDINTVDDFLKAYHQMGPACLRKLLGDKVPKNTWKKMINNALECDAPIAPLTSDPSVGVHLEVDGQKSLNEFENYFVGNYEAIEGQAFEKMGEEDYFNFDDNDYPPLMLLQEEGSTSKASGCP